MWTREDTCGIVEVDQLTLEYCLRRLKRCTILTEGSPRSWNSCSSLLRSYITTKCTLFHIVRPVRSQVHMSTLKVPLLTSSSNICVHTLVWNTSFSSTMQTCVGGGGGEENEKREGEHAEIKTAQLCCPQLIFTMIPWVGCLAISYKRTLWRMRDAHTAELSKQKMISSRQVSQTHTAHHILFSINAHSLGSHSSRTRQGCLLLPVRELRGGVRRRRRRWWKNSGGGGDERGGGTRWLSMLTPGTEGGAQEGKERGKWGGKGKGGSGGKLIREDKMIYLYAHILTWTHRRMPYTSLVGHTVVMATQAKLSSRQVSG